MKNICSAILVLLAYLIPMGVGMTMTGWAGWVMVSLLLNLVFFSFNISANDRLGASIVVFVLGVALTIIVGITGITTLLWGTIVMFLGFLVLTDKGVFDS